MGHDCFLKSVQIINHQSFYSRRYTVSHPDSVVKWQRHTSCLAVSVLSWTSMIRDRNVIPDIVIVCYGILRYHLLSTRNDSRSWQFPLIMLILGASSCKSLVHWKTACITIVSGTATMLLLEEDIYLPPHWFQYSSYPPVWCSLLNLHPHYSSRMPPPLNSLGLHPLASSTESPLHLFFFLRKPLLQQVYPLTSTTQSPPLV